MGEMLVLGMKLVQRERGFAEPCRG